MTARAEQVRIAALSIATAIDLGVFRGKLPPLPGDQLTIAAGTKLQGINKRGGERELGFGVDDVLYKFLHWLHGDQYADASAARITQADAIAFVLVVVMLAGIAGRLIRLLQLAPGRHL